MTMKYKIVKEKHRTLKNYGKYRAKAVHHQTIFQADLEEEITANCSAKASDVRLVLTELAEAMSCHLKHGDRVKINGIGTFKLDIVSVCRDRASELSLPRDLRKVQVHFIPESKNGVKTLYEGVKYVREK